MPEFVFQDAPLRVGQSHAGHVASFALTSTVGCGAVVVDVAYNLIHDGKSGIVLEAAPSPYITVYDHLVKLGSIQGQLIVSLRR